MSTYVTIDGRSYYSLCSKCKDKSCYSCVIQKYQEDLKDGDLYEKVLDLIKEYIKERNQIVEDCR